ncbi:transcriptional regulator [Actinosynnema sp. ALI-1.44]|uniref:TFIIB-type zinc ribbon-containing protein n=1 Tax=Actinosynnema sp. ALI-1.44 TaxID=1933779 RepID=UPI00097BE340|nr:zf-TFIIB domain-containing protein [Actinosynnema sp. ALI-1.44]ONI73175.1 transcriptional regulator [Actinosynnema sp. ALI-1.44]
MICPKCQNMMQTVDRGGVHIDQCQGCRGIFLDRGELEQIANAEQRYQQQYAPPPMAPPAMYRGDSAPPYRGGHKDSAPPYRGGHGGYKDSAPPYGGGYGHRGDSPPPYGGHGGYGHKRKRKSFLEELFD